MNVVSPGVIATEMNSEYSEADMSALQRKLRQGRIGLEEVAEAVYYLASDKASFINGQVLE